MPRGVDQAGHGDDLAAANDQGPGFSFRSRDLGVDEHVLHLLPAAREPVAGPPASYLKPWELGFDAPLAPANAAVEGDWRLLEPDAVVLTDGGEPLAEVDALRALARCEQRIELRGALFGQPQQVPLGARVEPVEEWEDLVADQAAGGLGVRAVMARIEADSGAVRLGLLAPEGE